MNAEQMLQQTNAIDAISRELRVDPATAQAGATALLPQILSGFQKPAAPAQPQPALSGLGDWVDCWERLAAWAAAVCSTT